ncbi:hypothetical protein GCM10007063_33800 [Lentibacillus kapialis]|uniref:Uncharacterized protein n=1 Tax=Lentibacillus kapialis TaxID=340214 RepID=A0A917Q300_9BACI|nr:hypothetical protein [Lentibacillus kapialis]GGK08624.1 hypothetical protein GCM10007063_33800 [Lentibacillus kapialis]
MNVTDRTLQNKAKNHKKLFEKYWIESNHLYFNGAHFYLAFYQRFNSTKIVILTVESDISNKVYKEAFEWLVILMNRMSATREIGTERKNINMKGFYKTRSFLNEALVKAGLSDYESNVLQECLQSMNTAISLQNRMIELMDEFEHYREAKEKQGSQYTIQNIEHVHDLHAEMDYIQFTQGQTSYKSIDYFASLYDIISQNKTFSRLANAEIKQYIRQFSQGKEKLKTSLDQATYVDDLETLSKEEFIKTVQRDYLKRQKESTKTLIKDLRYPKLSR